MNDPLYTILIHPNDPDEIRGFWSECVELGVASMGDTPVEALRMLADAMELHLEDLDANPIRDS